MTDYTIEIERKLLAAGVLDDAARAALSRELSSEGWLPEDVALVRATLREAQDPARELGIILADKAKRSRRILDAHREALGPDDREPDHVHAAGDVVGRERDAEARARGISVPELQAERYDQSIWTQLAVECRPPSCEAGRCNTRSWEPACCVREWLRRGGYGIVMDPTIWETVARHCEKHPTEPWTIERLRRRWSEDRGPKKIKELMSEVYAETIANRAQQESERVAAKESRDLTQVAQRELRARRLDLAPPVTAGAVNPVAAENARLQAERDGKTAERAWLARNGGST
jgi:hypothetical protein